MRRLSADRFAFPPPSWKDPVSRLEKGLNLDIVRFAVGKNLSPPRALTATQVEGPRTRAHVCKQRFVADNPESLYSGAVLFPQRGQNWRAQDTLEEAGTGIVVLGAAEAFLYLGGWFNPEAFTPPRFADGFECADGIHSGFRLNPTKGVFGQRVFLR